MKTSAVNTKLTFGTKKMTIISEFVVTELVNNINYSQCRAEGSRGAIYVVMRRKDNSYFLVGKGF